MFARPEESGASRRFAIELVKQCIADRGPVHHHVIYNRLGRRAWKHAFARVGPASRACRGTAWSKRRAVTADAATSGNVDEGGNPQTRSAARIKTGEIAGEEPSIEGYSSWVRKQTVPLPNIVLVTKRVGSWVEAVKRASRYLRTDDRPCCSESKPLQRAQW